MTREAYARFIPGEEIDRVHAWQFAAIDTATQLLEAQVREREAQEAAQALQTSRDAAYREGYEAGVAQAQAQAQAQAEQRIQAFQAHQGLATQARLDALLAQAAERFADRQQELAQQVLTLACALARQVLMRELSVDAQSALPVIHAAVQQLGAGYEQASLRLHPQDIEALGAQLGSDQTGMRLQLRADPGVTPGGCLLEAGGAVLDASVETRWQRVVAQLGLALSWGEDLPDPAASLAADLEADHVE